MKINFTNKEYRLLVTMLDIADWIMNANHSGERMETKPYRALRNRILSHADEMGMKGCFVKEGETYYETRAYEDASEGMPFIDEYCDEAFWEELISRLAQRDYAERYGDEEVGVSTRIERIHPLEEVYGKEFSEAGLKNLRVMAPFPFREKH